MPVDLVGAVVGYLVQLLGDAGITLVRSSRDKRSLRKAVQQAAEAVVDRADPESRELLRSGLRQCFASGLRVSFDGAVPIGDALRVAIADQVDQLAHCVNINTGKPFYDNIPISPDWVRTEVTDALIAALRRHAAREGLSELVRGLDSSDILARLDTLSVQMVQVTARLGDVGALDLRLPAAAGRLPSDIGSFTGRHKELQRVVRALTERATFGGLVQIDTINGMAGVGKTAFAIHAAHHIAHRYPDAQIFLRLHAHTPGQQPVDSTDALVSLLQTIGIRAQDIPADSDARADLWRQRMAGKKALLLLDDATGTEQVLPLLPGTAETLVLITSRRRLTALPEALPVSLEVLDTAEAAELFVRLADRHDLQPSDSAVVEVVRLCGYLPLAIGMMASQLKHHRTWSTIDLADHLASATSRLDPLRAENISVSAALDLSLLDLTGEQRWLFCRLGFHPGTDIDAYCAAALDDIDLQEAQELLDELYGHHLLDEPTRGRYRFHDLVREYARALAIAQGPGHREEVMSRLRDYYLHAAFLAGRVLRRQASVDPDLPVLENPPRWTPELTTREQSISWLEVERPTLSAVIEEATAEAPGHTVAITAALSDFLRLQGHWDQAVQLHRIAFMIAQSGNDPLSAAQALFDLGEIQYLTDNYGGASTSLTKAMTLYRDVGHRFGEAKALNRLGAVQRLIGDYATASATQEEALALYRALGNKLGQADALNELGSIRWLTDSYVAATATQRQALALYREIGDQLGEAGALKKLGMVLYLTGELALALDTLGQALTLYRGLGDRFGEAGTLNEMGVAQQLLGEYPAAEASQRQSLALYNELGDRLGQADALNQLGIVEGLTGDYSNANAHITQALTLFQTLGNRHSEAEALNNLGELLAISATAGGDCDQFAIALSISRDIGAQHEEARALEGLGRYQLAWGSRERGIEHLQLALVIYERIGSPEAQRVHVTLSTGNTDGADDAHQADAWTRPGS